MTGVVAVPEVYNHVLEASSRYICWLASIHVSSSPSCQLLCLQRWADWHQRPLPHPPAKRAFAGRSWANMADLQQEDSWAAGERRAFLHLGSYISCSGESRYIWFHLPWYFQRCTLLSFFWQNNMNYKSLDVLVRCPQAPIPNLGQDLLPPAAVPSSGAPPSPTPASAVQSSVHPSSVTTSATAAVVMPVTSVAMPTPVNQNQAPPPAPEMDDFADFADFQSAAAAPSQNPIISSPPSHHPL